MRSRFRCFWPIVIGVLLLIAPATGFAVVGQEAGFGVDANGVNYARYWDATGNWFEQYVYGSNTWTLWVDVDGAGTSYTPGDENGDYYFQYTGVDANGTQIEDWQYRNDGVVETREYQINNLTGYYDFEYEYQDFNVGGQYRQVEIYNDPFSNTSYNYDAWFVDYNSDGNLQNDWMKWSWNENFAAVSGYTQSGVVEVNFFTNYAYGTIFEQNVNSGSYELTDSYGWDADDNGSVGWWNGEFGVNGNFESLVNEFNDIGVYSNEGYSANRGWSWQEYRQGDRYTTGGQYEIYSRRDENVFSGDFYQENETWFDYDGDGVKENDWDWASTYQDYYAESSSYSEGAGLYTGSRSVVYNPEEKYRYYTNSYADGDAYTSSEVNYVADADGDGSLEWGNVYKDSYDRSDDYTVIQRTRYEVEEGYNWTGSLVQVDGFNNMDMYSVNWQSNYSYGNGAGESRSYSEVGDLTSYAYAYTRRNAWSQRTETENINIVYGQYATRSFTNTFDAGRTVTENGLYYDFDGNTTYANTGDNYNSSNFEVREEIEVVNSGAWEGYEYNYANYTGSGVNSYIHNEIWTNTGNGNVYQEVAYDDLATGVEWDIDLYTAGGSPAPTQGAQSIDYGSDVATYIWVPEINQWYLLAVTPYSL
ncbi:MAG: hypothetical protein V2J65_09975 [Desulfobacteraceae bacterium]|nr:hypothetical protein [Desulfobacteraceae bacterium]